MRMHGEPPIAASDAAIPGTARGQEGHRCGRRFHADRRVHILRDRVVYRDLGADHFTKRDPAKAAKRLLKRLEGLGEAVEARSVSAVVSI
jgi:hypothetical protein